MDVSLMIEGQIGLNWARWKRVAAFAEDAGFHGLYRSDHFTNPRPPDDDSLELIPSLTYLATATQRITFGQLVSPVSFRDPVILAREAAAISDLSGGRLVLGLGAGWQQREHDAFGYDLGDVETRTARLREGLEVATLLLRSDEPVSFDGRFYRLREATLLPRPAARIPICVGGNGMRRTLLLAARYADVWNGTGLAPDDFAARCGRLDDLLEQNGRKAGDLRRSVMTGVFLGEDLPARFEGHPALGGMSQPQLVTELTSRGLIAGSAEQVRAQLQALAAAGCDEVMLQWLWLDDEQGLQALARAVLP